MNTPRYRYRIVPCVLGCLTLLSACNREEAVRSYNVPKEQGAVADARGGGEPAVRPAADALPPGHPAVPPAGSSPAANATGSPADSGAEAKDPTWTLPAKWKPLPLGMMDFARFASGEQPGALPVTVTSARGSMLGNVNRWEGQMGLPPTGEADLAKVLHESKVNGAAAFNLDLKSADGRRMLVVVIPRGADSWFIKLSGPADAVAAVKGDFDAFAQSIKFGSGAAAGSTPPVSSPAVAMPAAPPASGSPSAAPFTYSTPAGWTAQPTGAAGAMGIRRVAAFTIATDTGKAEVTVIPLSADSGDLAANINRWRGQVGLPPDGEAYQPKVVQVDGVPSLLIDLTGPTVADGKAKRMLLAIRTEGQTSWFFKMLGTADIVASQQEAFDAFLKSVKFTPAAK